MLILHPIREKYFGQFGTVKEVAFIHADDLTYTRSCEVAMQSTDSVTNILATPRHVIDEREVTVEPYLGREAHEWLFLEGEYKLILKELDVSQHESVLYKKLEKAFANCGRYSEIHLMKTPKRGLSGYVLPCIFILMFSLVLVGVYVVLLYNF
ncbi:putative nucleotide-binding alpha-beta plait domain superfamily, RNA-binding domain superfamily [Helianthus annuus]|nr:putative nucleotide-binding alpha-beta plait domain superfamily, RNA-binding domain superfamily [Helianthus annuus]KAJ0590465.1 putative nucleotide-binding alpha-beta plait domain superfamily, RNA-binding domain superfamily [Helianthus annuus]KAJ0598245.1 putative nucleotide-binding alpha-beta plait domain superfamily, RNA-binding domain superfamily [Helianthus annuus]KAJ0762522.1 putative nucleotide-binding alpha-beta plait domain superfamily, RNA-binding domain superfamily [Helianthus annuu